MTDQATPKIMESKLSIMVRVWLDPPSHKAGYSNNHRLSKTQEGWSTSRASAIEK